MWKKLLLKTLQLYVIDGNSQQSFIWCQTLVGHNYNTFILIVSNILSSFFLRIIEVLTYLLLWAFIFKKNVILGCNFAEEMGRCLICTTRNTIYLNHYSAIASAEWFDSLGSILNFIYGDLDFVYLLHSNIIIEELDAPYACGLNTHVLYIIGRGTSRYFQ